MNENERPVLGTTEAAVLTCVELIARSAQMSEEHMAYWLDLYYQIRSRHEAGKSTSTDELLRLLEKLEAKIDGLTVAVKVEETPHPSAAPTPSPQGEGNESDKIVYTDGVKKFSDYVEERMKQAEKRKPTPPAADQRVMAEKQGIPKMTRGDARFKAVAAERLRAVRANGVTVLMIAEESDGALTEGAILDILEAKYRPLSDYRALAAALDRCEAKLKA